MFHYNVRDIFYNDMKLLTVKKLGKTLNLLQLEAISSYMH